MQMPTSSTVWWAPVCRSPVARTVEVETAVAGEQVEHVIEEPDPGVPRARAVSVERQADADLGLAGPAVDLGGAGHLGAGHSAIVANAGLHRPGVQLEALRPGDRRRRAGQRARRLGRSAPR